MAPSPEAPSMTRAIELYLKKINAGETVAPVVLDGQSPDRAYILAQEAKPAKRRPAPKTAAATTKNSTTKNSASASKAKRNSRQEVRFIHPVEIDCFGDAPIYSAARTAAEIPNTDRSVVRGRGTGLCVPDSLSGTGRAAGTSTGSREHAGRS